MYRATTSTGRQRESDDGVAERAPQSGVAAGSDDHELPTCGDIAHRRCLTAAGNEACQSSLPVETSKARSLSSRDAAMNTSPLAVTIGPPRFGRPRMNPMAIDPSGICQRKVARREVNGRERAPGRRVAGNAEDRGEQRPLGSVGRAEARSDLGLRCGGASGGIIGTGNQPHDVRNAHGVDDEQPILPVEGAAAPVHATAAEGENDSAAQARRRVEPVGAQSFDLPPAQESIDEGETPGIVGAEALRDQGAAEPRGSAA